MIVPANDNRRGTYYPVPRTLAEAECEGCGKIGLPAIICFAEAAHFVCEECADGKLMTKSRLVEMIIG